MKALIAALILFSVMVLGVSPAQAEGEGGYVGGVLGLSVPNASNTTARPMYGLVAGAKLGSEFGIGGYYLSSQKQEDANGTKFDFNFDLYGIEGAYYFEGEAKGVHLGLRLGTSKIKSSNNTGSSMHWGFVAGYNKFFGANFSVGGEFSYLMIEKADPISSFNTLNFLAGVRLWF